MSRMQAIYPALYPPLQANDFAKYGLVSSLPKAPDIPNGWAEGITFRPEFVSNLNSGLGPMIDTISCQAFGAFPTFTGPATQTEYPFAVIDMEECSPLGMKAAEAEAVARRKLDAGLSYAMAAELKSGTARGANGVGLDAATAVTTSIQDPVSALAVAEQAIADGLHGKRGVIHLSAQLLQVLAASFAVYLNGGQYVTANGNLVVADAGYGTTTYIYATDMIYTVLGDVTVTGPVQTSLASTNLQRIYVDRPAMFVWAHELNKKVPVDFDAEGDDTIGMSSVSLVNVNDTNAAGGAQLAAANGYRRGLTIFNDSTVALYVKFGTGVSNVSKTFTLAAGGFYEMPANTIYTGAVWGVWQGDTSGYANVTEW